MNSYTLFSHVVEAAGPLSCYRSHIELEAMGLLPADDYLRDQIQPLTDSDADIRAAFAIWCALAPDPKHLEASRHLFKLIQSGKGRVPTAADGENFVMTLAQVLREGPQAMGVQAVFISHVFAGNGTMKGRASITYKDGATTHYEAGHIYPAECWQGATLDATLLRTIHEDLTSAAVPWPAAPLQPLRPLTFQGGQILTQ
jgi:hypothetical protein